MANVIAQIHASGAFADAQIIEIFDTATMDEARSAASYRPPGQWLFRCAEMDDTWRLGQDGP